MFIEFVHEVRSATRLPEVAGVTFSDSESAPVPKFLNPDPGPAIFQIWQSDSCSDSGYNHRSNHNLPMFLLRNDPIDSYCQNWKATPDPGPVFHKFLTPGLDPGPKEKRRILPESNPALRTRCHLCRLPIERTREVCSLLKIQGCMHTACVLWDFWAHASDVVTSRRFLMRLVWSAEVSQSSKSDASIQKQVLLELRPYQTHQKRTWRHEIRRTC